MIYFLHIFPLNTGSKNVKNCKHTEIKKKALEIAYRTIILPVLYGCEIWSLTLREERRLGVFENGVLRGIFGRKRE
jgi:hypothetical protein